MKPLLVKAFSLIQALFIIWICLSLLLHGKANAQRLHESDLTYRGAFSFPSGDPWAYGGHALAFFPEGDPSGPNDGYPGSLYAAGHAVQGLAGEISIPVPIKTTDYSLFSKGNVLQNLADITGGWKDNCTYHEDCIYRELSGLAFLPNVSRIVWNLRDWYNAVAYDQDSLGWSDTDLTHAQGVWHVGERNNPLFHNARTCNYLFKAPQDFASEHLSGKWLMAGNHREGGALGGSQGPTLYALAPWEDGNPPVSGQNLDATLLLYYPEIYDCVWTDPSVCHFPGYRAKDNWVGGAWVQTASKSAVLIFGVKGLGNSCYGSQAECGGDPCDMYKGYHAYPYAAQILFYDPEELKQVVAGTRDPWTVLPYETMNLTDHMLDEGCPELGAAAFDRNNGLIYLTEQTAGPSDETVVHVWQVAVSEGPVVLYVNQTDPACGGNSPCYGTIQAALVAATTGAHIRVSEGDYNETPLLDQSRILTISGSWNAAFSTQTSNLTRIRSLRVTMGTLHVREMCIGP